jgi:adenosylcobinamide-phosphate synthase
VEREVADELVGALAADPVALSVAVLIDLALGDPVYRAHPVRLIGATIAGTERVLRQMGAGGYLGGVALVLAVALLWVTGVSAVVIGSAAIAPWIGRVVHVGFVYSLLALGDLLRHVWRVEVAATAGDVERARALLGDLVGRDTSALDVAACRRAAIESLAESLTDGFISALFWYALGGLPGLVLFKVASTLDSAVGYKTPAYARFGWGGARLDDLMNYVPARLTWLFVSAAALVVPGASARKACMIGAAQHAALPSPNSGWSEAAIAGAISRRLVGPIWMRGALVTEQWIGDPGDPPAGARGDIARAMRVVATAALLATALSVAMLAAMRP